MAVLADFIMHAPPLMVGAEAVYPFSASLAEKYVFTSRYEDEVKLHRVSPDGKHIMLPRGLCPIGPNTTDLRRYGEIAHFPKSPLPRPYQVDMFGKVANFLMSGKSGVAVAGTGWGKTVLGYHAMACVGRKTLVITTKEDIFDKWVNDAPKFLGLEPHEIGVIRGDKCEVVGTKLVVAMIHSLSKEGRYPSWITLDFGLIIYDECHRVPADQFQAVASMFPAVLRLGLSATPHRSDGKELVVFSHIGPIFAAAELEQLVPKILRFRTGWQCPRFYEYDKETNERKLVRMPHQAGRTSRVEKAIASDPDRNLLLAHLINEAFEKDRKIVIFSTLHEHLHTIHRTVIHKHGISGRKLGFYVGATTKAEKEHRDRELGKPVIFTTYTMMGEGTDVPWLDTCILAMPRADVRQPVGRIRREYPGKNPGVVMDLIDNDSPVFAGYAASRGAWYRRLGCVVKDMN